MKHENRVLAVKLRPVCHNGHRVRLKNTMSLVRIPQERKYLRVLPGDEVCLCISACELKGCEIESSKIIDRVVVFTYID
jgi:translation initiation factor IF-1